MDVNALIKDFMYCRGNMREFINRRFQDPEKTTLILKYFDYIVTKEGDKFYVTPDLETVGECREEYSFEGINKDTVVVDLGANIGGFSIPAARLVKFVLSYEPIRYKELHNNMELNNIKNMCIHQEGVGNGEKFIINWREQKNVEFPTHTFRHLLLDAISYTEVNEERKIFLKCDIEGAEKYVNPKDLAQFSQIEMELHYDKKVCNRIINELKNTHIVTLTNEGAYGIYGILHATRF